MNKLQADAIQGIRSALDSRRLFQFWDSAENHLGNEVVNKVFSKLGLSNFFTGTTCVFKAYIFKDIRFPDSVTEDTYLSYSLILKQKKIAYNGDYGSYEEVSPDLKAYVSRRRRWSCGHNETFFNHLKKIFLSRLRYVLKIQLLFHGAYFLVPTLIVIVLNCFGLFYFFQFTENFQYFTLLVGVMLTLYLNLLISDSIRRYFENLLFSFLWIFPQVTIASVLVYKLTDNELFYQLLSFPYFGELFWFQLILIALPLILLIVGSLKLARPSIKYFLIYFPTYPIALFLDIFSSYVGFVDYVLKRREWGKISRTNTFDDENLPDLVLSSLLINKVLKPRYWFYISLPVVFSVSVLAHDLLVFDNCGHPVYLLGKPIFYEKEEYDPKLDFQLVKSRANAEGKLKVDAIAKITSSELREIDVKYGFGGHQEISKRLNGKDIEIVDSLEMPYGFESKNFQMQIQTGNETCYLNVPFTTQLVDIVRGKLNLNSEPFLIKGIIPSFSTAIVNLGLKEGLEQIKSIAANAVRFYHTPTEQAMDLVKDLGLMIISQPDQTTWHNIRLNSRDSYHTLVDRYEEHVHKTKDSPFILFDHLGNELEIYDAKERVVTNIKKALKKAREFDYFRSPLSYSTYRIFESYPVDILGINMLDTGVTYWEKGVDLIKDHNDAFYASEFGGFVAFYERTDSLLRAQRITEYWENLQKNNGSGVMFFQSHDNWAQPGITGYNDPFNPEQPDDLRGLWDHLNKEKYILNHLRKLYSDFDVEEVGDNIQLTNRREYNISNLYVNDQFIGELKPDTSAIFSFDFNAAIEVRYVTHSGLHHHYELPIVKRHEDRPVFENDFVRVQGSGRTYTGELAKDDLLKFRLPKHWDSYVINGQVERNDELNEYRFSDPSRMEFSDVQWRTTRSTWKKFHHPIESGGEYQIRVNLPEIASLDEYSIVFDGIGSQNLLLYNGKGEYRSISVHNYREERLQIRDILKFVDNGWLYFRIQRNAIGYVHSRHTKDRKMVSIDFQKPYLEKIHRFELEKVD